MPRILIRSHKNPFRTASADLTVAKNLIGSNVGNLVFSQAIYRLLATSDAVLQTSGIARKEADEINERFDHLVIPLANAFRQRYLPTLDILSEVIEGVRIPVTVVGVGAQADLDGSVRSQRQVDASTRRFVRAVLERSPSIGVRGEFTQNYLHSLGFGPDVVEVIGCPSMFMYGPDLRVEKRVPELTPGSPIALNISPYVAEMGPISLDHAARYPNLVYVAQNRKSLELLLYGEYPMGHKSETRRSGVPTTLDHPLMRQDRIRMCLDPQTWFEHLKGYDFSFGTRIHGNISSLLAGTPALVLAHDSRTLELAEYHRIPNRMIDSLGERPDAAALYAEADWAPMNAAHAERWDRFSEFLAHHRLRHTYLPGESAAAFDAQLAATDYPPPVGTLAGATLEELYAMRRALLATEAELRAAKAELGTARTSSLVRRGRRKARRLLGTVTDRWRTRPADGSA